MYVEMNNVLSISLFSFESEADSSIIKIPQRKVRVKSNKAFWMFMQMLSFILMIILITDPEAKTRKAIMIAINGEYSARKQNSEAKMTLSSINKLKEVNTIYFFRLSPE